MLSTIFWVLFIGNQAIQAAPTLADCAALKATVQAKHVATHELVACVPQEKAR